MRTTPLLVMLFSLAAAAQHYHGIRALTKRGVMKACSNLVIKSNNGDRKVAIVVNSSSSMRKSDPDNLRLSAARALNDFLISSSEAEGDKKADQVVVVGFESNPYNVFGPGDSGDPAANAAINRINSTWGTTIASGVLMATEYIETMAGITKDRSAIVVFTDGFDSDEENLVATINKAKSLGIRVSFGYLDPRRNVYTQPEEVLYAVRNSKGVYAMIALAAGSQNFINYVLLNGLTYLDNPQGAGDHLLSGLATTHFLSGSGTVKLQYGAEKGEHVNFTVVSFTREKLAVEARMDGKTLYKSERATIANQELAVIAQDEGVLELHVSSPDAPSDGLFSVLTNSNLPIKNCTVAPESEVKEGGLSLGAKAGIGAGAALAALGLLGGGGYPAYKAFIGAGEMMYTAKDAFVPSAKDGGFHHPGSDQPWGHNSGVKHGGLPSHGMHPEGQGPNSSLPVEPHRHHSVPLDNHLPTDVREGQIHNNQLDLRDGHFGCDSQIDPRNGQIGSENNINPRDGYWGPNPHDGQWANPHDGGISPPSDFNPNPSPPQQPSNLVFPVLIVPMPMAIPIRHQPEKRKHHHHPWLPQNLACKHLECEFNKPNHVCSSMETPCECMCGDRNCPWWR